jgi:ubiquinone/menaquinone biosynthesis C-methylase UbiE
MDKLNFGIDAPKITAKLFIIPGVLSFLYVLSLVFFGINYISSIIYLVLFCPFIITGLLMILSSKIFKIKNRNIIITKMKLTGSEKILDIGCGRGLYTIGFAEKITNGTVYGIDIWNAEDISMNSETAVMENIKKSNTREKIILKTEDMRGMSFDNDFFDIIVASFSIHNLNKIDEVKKALIEIIRVLKNNGSLIIIDFKYINVYKNIILDNNLQLIEETFAKGLFPISKNLIFKK